MIINFFIIAHILLLHQSQINFYGSDLADDLFESGSFDGAQRPLNIVFVILQITLSFLF